jgi:chemotaxis receptor (MCP) glutamine deamidase CheD
VTAALAAAGIPVTTTLTGGNAGRTLRVHIGTGLVTCKQAGSQEQTIAVRTTGGLRAAA